MEKQKNKNEVMERLDKIEKLLDEMKEDIEDKIIDKFDELNEDIKESLNKIKEDQEDNFDTLVGIIGPPGRR